MNHHQGLYPVPRVVSCQLVPFSAQSLAMVVMALFCSLCMKVPLSSSGVGGSLGKPFSLPPSSETGVIYTHTFPMGICPTHSTGHPERSIALNLLRTTTSYKTVHGVPVLPPHINI